MVQRVDNLTWLVGIPGGLTHRPDPASLALTRAIWFDDTNTVAGTTGAIAGPLLPPGSMLDWLMFTTAVDAENRFKVQFCLSLVPASPTTLAHALGGSVVFPDGLERPAKTSLYHSPADGYWLSQRLNAQVHQRAHYLCIGYHNGLVVNKLMYTRVRYRTP